MLRLPKSRGTVFFVHSIQAYRGSRDSYLIFALGGDEWLISWPSCFIPGREPQFCRGLCLFICENKNRSNLRNIALPICIFGTLDRRIFEAV